MSKIDQLKHKDFREMREMLRAMQAGELTVSRGIEILNIWWAGNWNDDMLPPVRQDLIEEDSMPVEIIDRLKQQLAAEQAKNVELREKVQKFIYSLEECTDFDGFTAYIATMDDYHETVEALDTPSDTSALEAIVKKVDELVRDRIASGFSQPHEEYFGDTIQLTIHALPAVILEDLK